MKLRRTACRLNVVVAVMACVFVAPSSAVAQSTDWRGPDSRTTLSLAEGWETFEDRASSPQEFVFWPGQPGWPPAAQCQLNVRQSEGGRAQALTNEIVRRWDASRLLGPRASLESLQIISFSNELVGDVQVGTVVAEANEGGEHFRLYSRSFLVETDGTFFSGLNCLLPLPADQNIERQIETFVAALRFEPLRAHP